MGEIIDRSGLPALVESLRGEGKTIVTFNGSFDVLHSGHVRCLQEAKGLGDILIVPLNSDASIRSYKGRSRPIVPERDRAEMLAALACVDYVVLFDETVCTGIISEIRPDIHCNGADWGPCCIEREAVEKGGGRVHILTWAPGRSTSEMLRRIRTLTDSPGAAFFSSETLSGGAAPDLAVGIRGLASRGLKLAVFSATPDGAEAVRETLAAAGIRLDGRYSQPYDRLSGLLERARDDLGLSLGSSWVISNDMRHVVMGREVNAKTILIGKAPQAYVMPHYEAADLAEAVSLVLGR